jgi:hypothetical protein
MEIPGQISAEIDNHRMVDAVQKALLHLDGRQGADEALRHRSQIMPNVRSERRLIGVGDDLPWRITSKLSCLYAPTRSTSRARAAESIPCAPAVEASHFLVGQGLREESGQSDAAANAENAARLSDDQRHRHSFDGTHISDLQSTIAVPNFQAVAQFTQKNVGASRGPSASDPIRAELPDVCRQFVMSALRRYCSLMGHTHPTSPFLY